MFAIKKSKSFTFVQFIIRMMMINNIAVNVDIIRHNPE